MNKHLLLVQSNRVLSFPEQSELLRIVRPVAEAIGAEPLISDASTRVTLQPDMAALTAAITQQSAVMTQHTAILAELVHLLRGDRDRALTGPNPDAVIQAILSRYPEIPTPFKS